MDTASTFALAAFNPASWGGWEILLVLLIVLIVFGPKRLPALSRAIGKSIRDFKKGLQDVKDDIEQADWDDDEKSAPKAPPVQQSAAPETQKPWHGDRPEPKAPTAGKPDAPADDKPQQG